MLKNPWLGSSTKARKTCQNEVFLASTRSRKFEEAGAQVIKKAPAYMMA
jgi:hypothetical protein